MIWYHYWVSEVKRFRGIVRHVVNESPIFKNKSVNYPWTNILHVWIKICRSSSILRIPVIIIKNNRNRNLKYKSLQNSVLILGPGPTFLKKDHHSSIDQKFEWKMVSENHIHSLLIRLDLYRSVPFAICVLKKLCIPRSIHDVSLNVRCACTILYIAT
jgi:hypothetical protein